MKSTETEQKEKVSPLDERMDMSNSQNEETSLSQEESVKSSNVTKFQDLTISFDVPSSTKSKLEEFTKAEQQMISNDSREKEKSDAKNALEEFIYDAKAKINYNLSDFVMAEDKSKLLKSLEDIQHWLYDNEDQEAVEYSKRLKELQNLLNPIIKRYEEWNERPEILDDYNRALNRSFEAICNLPDHKNNENILPEEIDNLRSVWQNSKLYLDQAMQKFSNSKKYQDVPVTVDELRRSLMKFKDDFQKSYLDLEKRVNAPRKQPQSLPGDGNDAPDSRNFVDNRPQLPDESKKD